MVFQLQNSNYCQLTNMAAAPVKRNELSLKRRMEVLDYADRNPGCGVRKVAKVFDYGKTEILSIISL